MVIAGENGLWPDNMPSEQPTTGEEGCTRRCRAMPSPCMLVCPTTHPPATLAPLPCQPTSLTALLPRGYPCPVGYSVATLGSSLASCTDVPTVFDSCSSLDGALLVTEVDASCKVRVFVAGDASCSAVNNLAVVEG